MFIRLAKVADIKPLAALHVESWRTNFRSILSQDFLENVAEEDRLECWQKRLNTPTKNQQVFVAEEEGHLLGFICIFTHHDKTWGTTIDNLHVKPNLKGKGIGTQLMKYTAEWLLNNLNNEPLNLWTLEENTLAQKFYESIGGKKIEIRPEIQVKGILYPSLRYGWDNPAALLDFTLKKIHAHTPLEQQPRAKTTDQVETPDSPSSIYCSTLPFLGASQQFNSTIPSSQPKELAESVDTIHPSPTALKK